MSLVNNIKQNFKRLASYQAGRRFINNYYYAKELRGEHPLRSYSIIVISILLIIVGLIASLTPILPGSVLYVPGVLMLTARSKVVAIGLDRLEMVWHKTVRKLKKLI